MAFGGVLFLLVALWDPLSANDDGFCADQPEVLRVRTREDIIIPCRFSYPRKFNPVKVRVYWRAGDGERCGTSKFIYNHTENYTEEDYSGRITLVGDPTRRSGSIGIRGLRRSDGDLKYCCRINITSSNGTTKEWQNRHMTQLVFTDEPTKLRVEQLDVIPAKVGASVTIPCRVTNNGEFGPSTQFRINWKAGYEDLCLDMNIYIYNKTDNYKHKDYKERVKLVSDPRGTGISSLQIENVIRNDSRRYCCVVQIDNNRGKKWIQSAHGTELIVGDMTTSPVYSVTQPSNTVVQDNETFTMNCHFTHPEDMDPLWIGVFWTFGDNWKTFVYHGDQGSIDSSYRGRTKLNGDAENSSTVSLQVHNFTQKDIGRYYCLVAFRFCKGNNGFFSVIQQGAGTMISGPQDSGIAYWIIILAIIASLLIVIMIVLILKKKGLICKGASTGENAPPSGAGIHLERLPDAEKDPPHADYYNVDHKAKVADPVVYAALDLATPQHVTSRAQPDPQSDTVYSVVKTK